MALPSSTQQVDQGPLKKEKPIRWAFVGWIVAGLLIFVLLWT
jgi:hypothetical protein